MSEAVKEELKGLLLLGEPLAPHTSWHIGGPAERYYRPYDIDDLALFLSTLPVDEPITWLGLGSNVLIADQGISGTVIHTLGMHSPAIKKDNNNLVRVEAGVPCAKLAKYGAKEGLAGSEFFAGIPGTIGGALAMNAGAFGGETWENVVEVEVINRKGERFKRTKADYEIGYRKVIGPKDEWFIAGYFQFKPGNTSESSQNIKQLLRKRNDTQPIGVFSCGSVFQNPPNNYAAKLIEESGLKGFTIGGAQISPKHANFIINLGSASSNDVLALIKHIQETVLKDHNIQLKPEVRILS